VHRRQGPLVHGQQPVFFDKTDDADLPHVLKVETYAANKQQVNKGSKFGCYAIYA
jgi:hypothetical protein